MAIITELYPDIKKEHWSEWVEAFQMCPSTQRLKEHIQTWRTEGIRYSTLRSVAHLTHLWLPLLMEVWQEEGCPSKDVYFLTDKVVQESIKDVREVPKNVLETILTLSPMLSDSFVLQLLEYRKDLHLILKDYYKKCNNDKTISVIENYLDFTPQERLQILRQKYPSRYQHKSIPFLLAFQEDIKKLFEEHPSLYAEITLQDVKVLYDISTTFTTNLLETLKKMFEQRKDLVMEFVPNKDVLPFLTVVDPALFLVRQTMNPLEKISITVKSSYQTESFTKAFFVWKDRLPSLSVYIDTIMLETHQSIRLYLKMLDLACRYETMQPLSWNVRFNHKKAFHTPERWLAYLSGQATGAEVQEFEKMYGKKRGQHLQALWAQYPDTSQLRDEHNIMTLYTRLMLSDTSKPFLKIGDNDHCSNADLQEELGLLL